MPLLDIAVSQPCSCFQNNISAFRPEPNFCNKLVLGNDKGLGLASTFSRRSCCVRGRVGKNFTLGRAGLWRSGLMIKAVATLEITSVPRREGVNGYKDVLRMDVDSVSSSSSNVEPMSSSEDSTELDERERLRRLRISKANKGNTPWNKGKKHRPETVRLIKERTRLAMQDPKVKMKLANLGHAQSEETKLKIGVGVRLGWQKRREKLMLQETCHHEWRNLIAVAARKGLLGEEELQWDSYNVLNRQLDKEWLQSVEQRKNAPRIKGSKRAPKSAEQKRKIAQAIAAKWADPEYRNRVCSGLAKYHGIPEGVERKPKRKPTGDGQTRKRSPKKKDEGDDDLPKSQTQRIRSKRSKAPSYKDPLASSKLEMLKNIRAQRAAVMNKKSEAVNRAKLLIAEAEKAAEALEIAAKESPLAQSSLMESRMLIAEAYQIIESIENEEAIENDNDISENSTEPPLDLDEVINEGSLTQPEVQHRKVNGVHSIPATAKETDDFSFENFLLPDLFNGNASGSCFNDALETEEKLGNGFLALESDSMVEHFMLNLDDPKPSPNGSSVHTQKPSLVEMELSSENAEASTKQANVTKKWVRGRLVEVAEET